MYAVNNSRKQRGRPFKPGISGNARGRPKGARNRRTRALIEAAEADGETPLQYMLRVMRDQDAPARRRDEMARAAAPFVHARLTSVEPKPVSDPSKPEGANRIEVVFVRPKSEQDKDVC
jgi:hypothetical protein